MIPVFELITLFFQALNEKWGYIINTAGEIWTREKQNAATDSMAVKYGNKWIGRRVADCSGLFYWAFKQLGRNIYHGSNTIWRKHLSQKGRLIKGQRSDGQPIVPGTAVFKLQNGDDYYHIGLYVGDGSVIEAKGTRYGVVTSKLSEWSHWGLLKDVDYTQTQMEGAASTMNTLKNGSRGAAVKSLQAMLNNLGFDCGAVDGIFGKKTEAGVRAFQTAKGLVPDGIAGEATLEAVAVAASAVSYAEPPYSGEISPVEADNGNTVTFSLNLARNVAEGLYLALKNALGV